MSSSLSRCSLDLRTSIGGGRPPIHGREIGGRWNLSRADGGGLRLRARTATRRRRWSCPGRARRVGRLPELNDIGLQPDPQRSSRARATARFERQGARLVRRGRRQRQRHVPPARRRRSQRVDRADGASRRRRRLRPRRGRRRRASGASSSSRSTRSGDSQATRAARRPKPRTSVCATTRTRRGSCSCTAARRHEIPIRAQAHRLVRYMVERNAASAGAGALHARRADARGVGGRADALARRAREARLGAAQEARAVRRRAPDRERAPARLSNADVR